MCLSKWVRDENWYTFAITSTVLLKSVHGTQPSLASSSSTSLLPIFLPLINFEKYTQKLTSISNARLQHRYAPYLVQADLSLNHKSDKTVLSSKNVKYSVIIIYVPPSPSSQMRLHLTSNNYPFTLK